MKWQITDHAVERYRERVRDVAPNSARFCEIPRDLKTGVVCCEKTRSRWAQRLNRISLDREATFIQRLDGMVLYVVRGKAVITVFHWDSFQDESQ